MEPGYLTHSVIVSGKGNGCVLSIVTTDALVLKHQAISTHSTD